MSKGNKTNHSKKYARDADLKELKDAFIEFKNHEYSRFKRMMLFCFTGVWLTIVAAFIVGNFIG